MNSNVKELIGSIFSTAVKIVAVVIAIMFIYKYAVMAYDFGYRVFTEPPMSPDGGRVITVAIGEDAKTKDIGKMLEDRGLIRDGRLFMIQEFLNENHGKIKPGKYDLNTNMTADEMIVIMAQAEKTEEDDPLYNSDEVIPSVEDMLENDAAELENGNAPAPDEDDAASPDEMVGDE